MNPVELPGDVLERLLNGSHLTGEAELPVVLDALAPALGAERIAMYVADCRQQILVPFAPGDPDPGPELDVEGDGAGYAYRMMTTVVEADRTWVALVDGAERIGVLEARGGAPPGAERLRRLRATAALVAELLRSRKDFGDLVERVRRRMPMQLSAEIMESLLPPRTFATPDLIITGILEPCYDYGGDAFDYSVSPGTAHVALFDAMGHGTHAALLATIAVSAYRNARRTGLDLADTYRSIDKAVHAEYPDGFVTAMLGELDRRTGAWRKISAGHPGGLLLRDNRFLRRLRSPTAPPLGLGVADPEVVTTQLHRGDRIVMYTDGVAEARNSHGEFFGLQRLVEVITKNLARAQPAPETMRRVMHTILELHDDDLRDDATILMVGWHNEADSAALIPD